MPKSIAEKDFHGLVIPVRSFSGAHAVRVVHRCAQEISEHMHDWPCLTVQVLGGCTEAWDGTSARLEGPSVVLHPARHFHADRVDAGGFETVSLQFDPDWLPEKHPRFDRSRAWAGGKVAEAGRALAAKWLSGAENESALAQATLRFLEIASTEPPTPQPEWLPFVKNSLSAQDPPSTAEIAERLKLHPGWLAHAYRSAVGEGISETLRRHRVEQAASLLRMTELPAAMVAQEAGFCDQSHMNRSFRALLGRTPCSVRQEKHLL
ncbi:MAG TPA: AraC family transcriptional regulator [Chloroflexota bacterium]|nr:AraC family transcriptional regulator [Chloroflexota bacterium]